MVANSIDESCIIQGLAKAGIKSLEPYFCLSGLMISMIVKSEVGFCELSLVIEFNVGVLLTGCDMQRFLVLLYGEETWGMLDEEVDFWVLPCDPLNE